LRFALAHRAQLNIGVQEVIFIVFEMFEEATASERRFLLKEL
jgi:hypothetical protein